MLSTARKEPHNIGYCQSLFQKALSGLEMDSEHMEAAARPLEGTQDVEYSPACKLLNACWEQNTFLQHPEQQPGTGSLPQRWLYAVSMLVLEESQRLLQSGTWHPPHLGGVTTTPSPVLDSHGPRYPSRDGSTLGKRCMPVSPQSRCQCILCSRKAHSFA